MSWDLTEFLLIFSSPELENLLRSYYPEVELPMKEHCHQILGCKDGYWPSLDLIWEPQNEQLQSHRVVWIATEIDLLLFYSRSHEEISSVANFLLTATCSYTPFLFYFL